MIVFEPKLEDVRPLGREVSDVWNQAIWDCLFQEVDIETGDLLFEWRASEHVDLDSTFMGLDAWSNVGTRENPFDPEHLNSIEKDGLGNYLVSARNFHSILYIDGKTKKTIWRLGGKGNYFQDLSAGHALNFAWQHNVRFVSPDAFPDIYGLPPNKEGTTTMLMTMFDNAAVDWDYFYGFPYSRGLLLELTYPTPGKHSKRDEIDISSDQTGLPRRGFGIQKTPLSKQDQEKVDATNGNNPAYTVRVIQEYVNPKHVRSSMQGSLQLLSQGSDNDPRILIGYGVNAVMTEFNSNGSVICDLHFGAETSWEKGDVQSYRASKSSWIGRPRYPPSAAIQRNSVYVSWNGATECKEWLLQAAEDLEEPTWIDVSRVAKGGFETSIALSSAENSVEQRYLRMLAVCPDGKLCENGASNIVDRGYLMTAVLNRVGSGNTPYVSLLILLGACITLVVWALRVRRRISGRRKTSSSIGILSGRRLD